VFKQSNSNFKIKINFLRFKNLESYFLQKFLLQSLSRGKKIKFFTTYVKYYYFNFLFNFYKKNNTFILKKLKNTVTRFSQYNTTATIFFLNNSFQF
jgi:hypothetical protein